VEAAEAGQLDGAWRWRRRLVAGGGSGEVLRLGGLYGHLARAKIGRQTHGVELTGEGGRRWLLGNFPRGAAELDVGEWHLAAEERGGGVGRSGAARPTRRKQIRKGHVIYFCVEWRGIWGAGGARARPCEGGRRRGSAQWCHVERRMEEGADTSDALSSGGSPGTAAPGHARGRQGKREKGESGGGWLVGWPAEWVSPFSEGKREGERMAGGPRVAVKCFQIGSKVFKLDSSQKPTFSDSKKF
jgi:hypothetical protein